MHNKKRKTNTMSKKQKKRVRCAIPGCQNHSDQGQFVGPVCGPCYHFVFEGVDNACTSQAFRNAFNFVWPKIQVHMARQLKDCLFGFEGCPAELAVATGSLADRELLSMLEGSRGSLEPHTKADAFTPRKLAELFRRLPKRRASPEPAKTAEAKVVPRYAQGRVHGKAR